MKSKLWLISGVGLFFAMPFVQCQKNDELCVEMSGTSFGISNAGNLQIKFSLTQSTLYPPSLAVWIEEPIRDTAATIYTTCKALHGNWGDGTDRPEVLPVWNRVHARERIKGDSLDAITSASPRGNAFELYYQIPQYFREKKVNLYIETNASFDNNEWYTGATKEQSKVNGQPSVVWKCAFETYDTLKTVKSFTIAGCGSQNGADNLIHVLTDSITTAKNLINTPTVKYMR
jgi:hypothetical protein